MTDSFPLPSFEEPRLARAVEALPREALDRLPYGTIRLDRHGTVILYSEAERRLSGSGSEERLGHDFFGRIAPCLDTPAYRARMERAREAGTLDLEFTHVGDFADRDREMTVRVQSASDGGLWIFLRRED